MSFVGSDGGGGSPAADVNAADGGAADLNEIQALVGKLQAS